MKKTIVGVICMMVFSLSSFCQTDLMPLQVDELSMRGERAYHDGNPFSGIAYARTNGQKTIEIIYRNGYKDGNHTEWYSNGKKKFDYQYSQGKMLDGEYKIWDEAGGVKKIEVYKNNKLLKSESYKSGKRNGITKEYYSSGELKTEMNYVNDVLSGKATSFTEQGKKTSEATYLGGKKSGAEIQYDDNGRVILKTEYDNASNPTSTVEYKYDNKGNVISEMHYDSNHLLNGVCFEKWDVSLTKWKRKYNHGQIEQTLEENKTNPANAIKAILAKNPSAVIGVARSITANALGLDHLNVEIQYDLKQASNQQALQTYIENCLFTTRLKYCEGNSTEAIDGMLTIKNYRTTSKYFAPQNYGYVNIPGGYKVTEYLDLELNNLHSTTGSSVDYKTVSYESKKMSTVQSATFDADKEIGYKIANLLYTMFPIRCKVIAVKDSRNNGKAKTVIIDAGLAVGIYKREKMRVFDLSDDTQPGGTIIAHLESTDDISNDRTVCKVIDGEDELTNILSSGRSLKVVFP